MLITDTLKSAGYGEVRASLSDETVTVAADMTGAELATQCTALLRERGYTFHAERPRTVRSAREWLTAVPIVLVLVAALLSIERLGLTALLSGRGASVGTAFLVGLVASVSTCLAVVGGLVLSLAATHAKQSATARPQVLFHLGRVLGFALLGGLLGVLGTAVRLSIYGSMLVGVVVSTIMLILGVQLLELTPRVRALTLPRTLFDRLSMYGAGARGWAPAMVGAATFFLPCGFTQSMQVVALTSGSFVQGALTMTAFALGTLPVLSLLSFGSLDVAKTRFRGVFFKVAGLLVILFALFNLYSALRVFGITTVFN
jgi:sulfite exporter TauE/SafE